MQSLPQTKFFPPVPHRDLITRPALVSWLQKELPQSRLLLLCAPAGYGKTTLLSSLAAALPDYPLAWFTLNNEDNDLMRFFSCLSEALAGIHPLLKEIIFTQVSASALLVNAGAAPFPAHQLVGQIINVILEQKIPPFTLALDDLHEINNPAVYEVLDYLLDHLPAQMHLAVSTRYEPPLHLNRLRARRQVAELGMDDLRFDVTESRHFINDLLCLELAESDVRHLQQKTEGWPVGLVLLTNRLRSLPPQRERSDFLDHLVPIDPSTFNYLAEEVLSHQPEALQKFLLETSILSDLTADLCREITGQENAGELLTEIYQRNLFLNLVSPGGENQRAVYRYHSLFAQFLQTILKQQRPEQWVVLHSRAAAAEKEAGRVIAHLLAAEKWEETAQWIENSGEQFLQNGLQTTVSGWVQSLPDDLLQKRSRLLYILGLSDLLRGDLELAGVNLNTALKRLQNGEDPHTHGQVLVRLASLAFICAEFERCAELVEQAGPYISGLEEQIDFLMLRASLALFWRSDWGQAATDLHQAMEIVETSNNPRYWFLISIYLAPEFSVIPGILDDLEVFCQKAQPYYGAQTTPLRLGIEDTWANIHLRRGRLQQAVETANNALMIKDQLGGYPFLGLNACLTASSATIGLGNYAAAEQFLQRAEQQIHEVDLNQALTGGLFYPRGHLLCLQGNYDEARTIFQQMGTLNHKLPLVDGLYSMLAGLLDLFAHRFVQAEDHLKKGVQQQTSEWVSLIYGSARLLLANLYWVWEKPKESMAEMERLILECQQNGCPGLILQDMAMAAPILKWMVKKGVQAGQAAALLELAGWSIQEEPTTPALLTERQLEILKLMAAGYSNQAIADELVLSLATVKSHGVHILDRLGVSSRMEAVARARVLGLII